MTDDSKDRPVDEFLVGFGVLHGLRAPAAQALVHFGELRLLTRWDDEILRAQLGCDPARWEDGGSSKPKLEAIEHSLAFLRFASEVAQVVDLTCDRREVVKAAFELCHDAGGEVCTRVPRVEAALNSGADATITPRDLLELGEIGRAWRAAALNLDGGPAHRRAQASSSLSAAVAASSPHVSAERMTLLAREDADDLLGAEVSKRILMHLREYKCAKCLRVAESVGLAGLLYKGSLIDRGHSRSGVAA